MKMWQKVLSLFLTASMAAFIGCAMQEQKDCCLCSSLRYHAPCLVDLETGDLIELTLYFPHPSLVAELADPQPEQGTFSLICFGNVLGMRDTSQMTVNIDVPSADKTSTLALCRECGAKLQTGYDGRYILADLYSQEVKTLIPISADTNMTLRCYEITMRNNEDNDGTAVSIRGLLPVEKDP